MPSSYSILKAELLADKMKKKEVEEEEGRRNDPWSTSQVYMSAETIRLIRDIGEKIHNTISLSTDEVSDFWVWPILGYRCDTRPSCHVDHGPIA